MKEIRTKNRINFTKLSPQFVSFLFGFILTQILLWWIGFYD